jgi:hypothetical protein
MSRNLKGKDFLTVYELMCQVCADVAQIYPCDARSAAEASRFCQEYGWEYVNYIGAMCPDCVKKMGEKGRPKKDEHNMFYWPYEEVEL